MPVHPDLAPAMRARRSPSLHQRLARLAAAVALGLVDNAPAATIVVNSSSAGSVAGSCTLFDAVTAVNTQSPVNQCIAGNGNNDTISLAGFTVPTTITFTAPVNGYLSALPIAKAVTITGNLDGNGNALVTIERSEISGVPFRLIQNGDNLTLHGLTLRNGYAGPGGAIYAIGSATVTLTNCRLSNNTTGSAGGAIYAQNGSVTLTNSTISGNSTVAGNGGGIYAGGTVYANESTISGNYTTGTGGGIYASAAVLTNTTISTNYAAVSGGGIFAAAVTLQFSTVAGNAVASGGIGGGIAITSYKVASTSTASIVSGNQPGNDIDSPAAVTLGGDHNLIGAHGANITLANPALTCDPHLGPLFDNGGPTWTRPLFIGSCALDAGPATGGPVTTDQRGFARKAGSATDLGAFEKQGLLDPPDLIFVNGFEQ
ncbi:MAG: right-handed parallel beta-helix repeat-containing protein [Rudaea sp.]|nr:right-handed parallel beta-helix repeat-containing protein [Rudaea sp.]